MERRGQILEIFEESGKVCCWTRQSCEGTRGTNGYPEHQVRGGGVTEMGHSGRGRGLRRIMSSLQDKEQVGQIENKLQGGDLTQPKI